MGQVSVLERPPTEVGVWPVESRHDATSRRSGLGVLWLAGVNLRLPVLALPPVLAQIHQDLGLSEVGVAALAGLPLLLFALGALPGALLIGKLGARRVLLVGLALIGTASALRGAGTSVWVLFGATVCMGAAIAVSQPALPALVRQWFPRTVTPATSVWSNGLLMGTILSGSLSLPIVLPLVGGSWQASFVVWGLPAVVAAGWLALTRQRPALVQRGGAAWWPAWRSRQVWQLGVLQSAGTLMFFGASTFIPDYLQATNRAELIAPSLAALSLGQLPGSALIGILPWKQVARPRTALLLSGATLAALPVLFLAPPIAFVAAAAVVGLCAGAALVLALAMPPLLAAPGEVPRLAGGTMAVGYSLVWLILLGAGIAWDTTHLPATAFLPAVFGALFVGVSGRTLGRGRR
jgi:MFS transporter, CP family, cyanate transporter